jgi:hypothetical protein
MPDCCAVIFVCVWLICCDSSVMCVEYNTGLAYGTPRQMHASRGSMDSNLDVAPLDRLLPHMLSCCLSS